MSTIKLKSYLLIGTLCVGFLCLFCRCTKKDEVTVTINSWVGFGPLYIAQEKGFFKDDKGNNLNIKIVKLEAASDRRASLLADRVQVVASTLDDIAVTLSQGVDAAAFCCADYSNGGDAIIAKKEVTLETLHNYKVAAQKGFVNHFFLLYVLHKNGKTMEPVYEKIRNMEPSDAGAAFLAGNIDVAVTWEPFISQAMQNRSDCKILASTADSLYNVAILDIFIAKKDWLKNNPSFAESFRKGWDKALEYLDKNKDESHRIIGKNLGIDAEEVKEMLEGVRYLNSKEGRDLVMPQIKELSKNVLDIWQAAGYVKESIKYSDLEKCFKLD